jgi:hypothetical protein
MCRLLRFRLDLQQRLRGKAMEEMEMEQGGIGPIVATVDTSREAELEQRLAAAEARISELMASAEKAPAAVTNGRKTLPSGMEVLLAKQGVAVESLEAGALDGALQSLSIEQRFAVKAQLLRAGLVG